MAKARVVKLKLISAADKGIKLTVDVHTCELSWDQEENLNVEISLTPSEIRKIMRKFK